MNIFVLDSDPVIAAQMHCNKHVVKMILESAQLLCTAHPKELAPYKHTHFNHPCAKWTRESQSNYQWLAKHSLALCVEYTSRYNKTHKTQTISEWLSNNLPDLPQVGLTPFAQAMPEQYRNSCPVTAYRTYYLGEKKDIAKWEPKATKPYWWIE